MRLIDRFRDLRLTRQVKKERRKKADQAQPQRHGFKLLPPAPPPEPRNREERRQEAKDKKLAGRREMRVRCKREHARAVSRSKHGRKCIPGGVVDDEDDNDSRKLVDSIRRDL